MSLSKYGCGCASKKTAYYTPTCSTCAPESAPTPCCESHNTVYLTSRCFRVTANTTTTASTFYLAFCGSKANEIPLNSNDVYFYHQSAGYIKIHSFSGVSYEVSLVDPSKAGAVIAPADCVDVAYGINTSSGAAISSNRCVVGLFTAPAVDAQETIAIWNGAGIPIGSTLNISNAGTLGAYTVISLVSVLGNVTSYRIENAGAGLPAGTVVNGGAAGECLVPVAVLTIIDFCTVSESQSVDIISGCKNGAPKGLKPTAKGQSPVSNSDLNWDLGTLQDFKVCLTLDGALKLSGDFCTAMDVVKIADVNREELVTLLAAATDAGLPLVGSINGTIVHITAYNSTTFEVTVSPALEDYLGSSTVLSFEAGDQLCILEEDLRSKDIQRSNFKDEEATLALNVALNLFPGNSYYLVGYNTSGVVTAQVVDATTALNPSLTGALVPRHTDSLLIREKICNSSASGVPQDLEIAYNYELTYSDIPNLVRVHHAFRSYIFTSDTGPTGQTPGSSLNSSQNASSGYLDGPSFESTLELPDTNLGFGGLSQTKSFPITAQDFKDFGIIPKCECANNIVWLLVVIQTLPTYAAGNDVINLALNFRRVIKKRPRHEIDTPANTPGLEGFLE